MAVVLANATLTATAFTHPFTRDRHGVPVAGAAVTSIRGPYPGAITQPDGGYPAEATPWRMRVDPRCHELRMGDQIAEPSTGRTWVIREARLCAVPGVPDVDFITVLADLDPPRIP